ncbi:MAG: hypothetical protein IT452_02455, partial [Planctomycetia bacterium]|nr:hypothetical protein [Planctomycetia bacterium]
MDEFACLTETGARVGPQPSDDAEAVALQARARGHALVQLYRRAPPDSDSLGPGRPASVCRIEEIAPDGSLAPAETGPRRLFHDLRDWLVAAAAAAGGEPESRAPRGPGPPGARRS